MGSRERHAVTCSERARRRHGGVHPGTGVQTTCHVEPVLPGKCRRTSRSFGSSSCASVVITHRGSGMTTPRRTPSPTRARDRSSRLEQPGLVRAHDDVHSKTASSNRLWGRSSLSWSRVEVVRTDTGKDRRTRPRGPPKEDRLRRETPTPASTPSPCRGGLRDPSPRCQGGTGRWWPPRERPPRALRRVPRSPRGWRRHRERRS